MSKKFGDTLDKATSDFIEEFGRLIAEGGLPPSIGRVMGLLVISDPGKLSAEEIGTKLKLSVGSVSAAISLLSRFGYVKRVTVPGERRFYYEFEARSWQNTIDLRLAQVKNAITVADKGLEIRKNDSRLLGMRNLYMQIHDAVKGIRVKTTL